MDDGRLCTPMFCTLLVSLLVCLIGLCYIFKTEEIDCNERMSQLQLELVENNVSISFVQYVVSDWVYKNSSHISKKMSQEIVVNVFKTNDPLFLLALIKTESTFDPTSISSKGASGLGQVMPEHKKRLIDAGILKEFKDIFDIQTGVKATEFMWDLHLKEQKGNVVKALTKYLGKKNDTYINQVLSDFDILRKMVKGVKK